MAADASRTGNVFHDGGKLRALWRILLFALIVAAIFIAGILVVAVVPYGEQLATALLVQSLLLLGAALLAGWIMLAWADRRAPGALGFLWTRQTPRELAGGMAIGGISLVAVMGALVVAGLISYRPEAGTLGSYAAALLSHLGVLALAAAAEEAVFRGYPFQVLVESVGAAAAIAITSGLFAAAHLGNPHVDALALTNIFLAGVMLSVAYLRTRSLWFATAVHLGWNWTMAAVLDLPVSGLDLFPTPLYSPEIAGPGWLTGGEFGPEGGLAATIAFLIALVAVLKLPGFDQAPELRARRPLVDERLSGGVFDPDQDRADAGVDRG